MDATKAPTKEQAPNDLLAVGPNGSDTVRDWRATAEMRHSEEDLEGGSSDYDMSDEEDEEDEEPEWLEDSIPRAQVKKPVVGAGKPAVDPRQAPPASGKKPTDASKGTSGGASNGAGKSTSGGGSSKK